jgi:exopolyphosphatase / guanosine-5'-triphosphate,3'-diphosphate pyrophosphatase
MKLGVIDLGTNTFSALMVEADGKGFQEIFRESVHVNLASDGIGYIQAAPFQRGLAAMAYFAEKIKILDIQKVTAIGTAALRTAANGVDFVNDVKNTTGIQIQVIDGSKEAQLIYDGVQQAYPFEKDYDMIMDIGGGSVEFIIANNEGFCWKQSFPIGVAVLRNHFHQQEPISEAEINATRQHLDAALQPLFEVIKKQPVRRLVGASGTFDVLENIFVQEKIHPLHAFISTTDAHDFYKDILKLNFEERCYFPNVPAARAGMLVVAMILIDFIVEKCDIQEIAASAYAMKEGILKKMLSDS